MFSTFSTVNSIASVIHHQAPIAPVAAEIAAITAAQTEETTTVLHTASTQMTGIRLRTLPTTATITAGAAEEVTTMKLTHREQPAAAVMGTIRMRRSLESMDTTRKNAAKSNSTKIKVEAIPPMKGRMIRLITLLCQWNRVTHKAALYFVHESDV